VFKLLEGRRPAHRWGERDRSCPLGTGLVLPMWHVSGTATEVEIANLLSVRSYRQATLEVDVAELVDRTSLAKHAPFLVRIGEKAHHPPWEMAS
jgi:hypothetical protein